MPTFSDDGPVPGRPDLPGSITKLCSEQSIDREVAVLTIFEGICGFSEIIERSRAQEIVLEKLPGVNLREHLQDSEISQEYLSLYQSVTVGVGLADCINHMHSGLFKPEAGPYAHYDISPGNVVIDDLEVFLIDFGLSFPVATPPPNFYNQQLGTPATISPEQYFGRPQLGTEADIFSFASLIYYMVHRGKYAFEHTDNKADMRLRFLHPPAPETGDSRLDALLTACWRNKPETRPTAPQLFRSLIEIQDTMD